jgi:hypothetical protein
MLRSLRSISDGPMNATRIPTPTRTNRVARRLLIFAALGFLSAACLMPTALPRLLRQTPTPAPLDFCVTVGPAPRFEFTFDKIEPDRAAPGQVVSVTGWGQFVDPCTRKVVTFWDPSVILFFDGQEAGAIVCQDDVCQGQLTVPEDAQPGTHTISINLSVSNGIPIIILEATDPARTPAPSPAVSGCGEGEGTEVVWPRLNELQPDRAAPGGAIKVLGSGGYIRCGESGYNESARSFQLSFDQAPVAQLGCYVNHCQVEFTVPAGTTPGLHTLSVEGGSERSVEIIQP